MVSLVEGNEEPFNHFAWLFFSKQCQWMESQFRWEKTEKISKLQTII